MSFVSPKQQPQLTETTAQISRKLKNPRATNAFSAACAAVASCYSEHRKMVNANFTIFGSLYKVGRT